MSKKISRSKTRIYAMEVIYQWLHTQQDIREVLGRYEQKPLVDKTYLNEVVLGAVTKKQEITEKISPYLSNRSIDEVSQLELSVLLFSSYEMMFQYDVPYRVVINEALNIVKQYGAQDSHRFINSVLDQLAKDVRGMECGDK